MTTQSRFSVHNEKHHPAPSGARRGILFLTLLLAMAGIGLLSGEAHALSKKNSYSKRAEAGFYGAEAKYKKLKKKPKYLKRRDKWLECIDQYKSVYLLNKKGAWAPAALYKTGERYSELYKYSRRQSDLANAREYLLLTRTYRTSRYSHEAIRILRTLPKAKATPPARKPVKTVKKSTSPKKKASATANHNPGPTASIKKVRFGSLPSKTRIVIDTDRAVSYTHGTLKQDKSNKKPERIYIDIKNCTLKKGVKRTVSVDDKRVETIRTARNSRDSVRVVLDINKYKDYKIFALRQPSRIVLDVWEKSQPSSHGHEPSGSSAITPGQIISSDDLARQFSLGVKRIVIDPGHGGHDPGAPGYLKGVKEKDVVLQISRRLAKKIKNQLNCEVILTRDKDRYLTLEERTRLANRKRADLFISIHTNASRNRRAYGMETYFLNLAKDNEAVSVAARENATSEKNISDLQTILNSLMKNTKINESSKLARFVQDSMVARVGAKYSNTKNKGVKQAPFYVLLGARMPSILVEAGFISNKRECKRLVSPAYQERVADSIVKGIKKYIEATNPSALASTKPGSRPGS